jgi:hypothetical protein
MCGENILKNGALEIRFFTMHTDLSVQEFLAKNCMTVVPQYPHSSHLVS